MFEKLRNIVLKSGSTAQAGHHGSEPHVLPLKTYFAVFGALLLLTILTVVVSVIGLPQPTAIIVAMVVAAIKATLVVLWFMHLKYDDRFYSLIFIISILFLALFFIFTSLDVFTRGQVNPEESSFSQDGLLLRQEFMKK
ncbi:cytochrome oxidase subunit IV [bacterium]|nr:cytochrome oxidase subunit IV [bacterium]